MTNRGQELPAWYYRVHALTIEEDREVDPEDFDEDISSLSSSSSYPDPETDEHDKDSDEDEDEDDQNYTELGRSYDGSDANYYYELKAQREERKLELQNMRELKDSKRTSKQKKESEVQEMYDSLKNAKKHNKAPLESIAGHFDLYSVDHNDYFYNSTMYRGKYVEFYHLDKDASLDQLPSARKDSQLQGRIYLDWATDCALGPFFAPKHAGLKEFPLTSI